MTQPKTPEEIAKEVCLNISSAWPESIAKEAAAIAYKEADKEACALHLAIANATEAFEAGDVRRLGTINETIQGLVDAAVHWGKCRIVEADKEVAGMSKMARAHSDNAVDRAKQNKRLKIRVAEQNKEIAELRAQSAVKS